MIEAAEESVRYRLPNRRPCETATLRWGGGRYQVTVGFDPATGRAREVFADGIKQGSELDALLDDACVITSIALQQGLSVADLARHLGRENVLPTAPASSILGEIAEVAANLEASRWR